MIGGAFQSVGAFAGLAGVLLYGFNHNANAVPWLLGSGLALLIVGGSLF